MVEGEGKAVASLGDHLPSLGLFGMGSIDHLRRILLITYPM